MKKLSLTIVLSLLAFCLQAQQPVWIAQAKTQLTLVPSSGPPYWGLIAHDGAGNAYVTGMFTDSIRLGNIVLQSAGDHDLFVAKIDSAGQWIWAKQAGGSGFDAATSVATDGQGNVVIAGGYSGTVQMGSTTLNAVGSTDVFAAKLDPAGNWLWAATAGSANGDGAMGVCTDATGDVYVVGDFRDTLQAGAQSILSLGLTDGFLGRLNGGSGAWQWLTRVGAKGNSDKLAAVRTDALGNVYLCGMFSDSLYCGTTLLVNPSINPTLSNYAELFLAKFDNTGTSQWAISGGGYDKEQATSLAVDPSGDIYVCGFTASDTIVFGAQTLVLPQQDHLLVAKASPAGQWQWVQPVRMSSTYLADIAAPAAGKVYVTGSFWGAVIFGTDTLLGDFNPPVNMGSSEVFISHINGSGQWQWARAAGGKGNDYCASICADNSGNLWLTGSFADSLRCGPVHAETSDTGRNELFVLRLRDTSAIVNGVGMPEWLSFASLYPNPASSVIILQSHEDAVCTIFDLAGQVLGRMDCAARKPVRVEVSAWPRGMYLYTFDRKQGGRQSGLFRLD